MRYNFLAFLMAMISLVAVGCNSHKSQKESADKNNSAEGSQVVGKAPSVSSPAKPTTSNKPQLNLPRVVRTKILNIFMKASDSSPVSTKAKGVMDISLCLEGDFNFDRETKLISSPAEVEQDFTIRILFRPSLSIFSITSYVEAEDAIAHEMTRQSFPNRNGVYQSNFKLKKDDTIRVGITSNSLSRAYTHDDLANENWPQAIIRFDEPCIFDGSAIP